MRADCGWTPRSTAGWRASRTRPGSRSTGCSRTRAASRAIPTTRACRSPASRARRSRRPSWSRSARAGSARSRPASGSATPNTNFIALGLIADRASGRPIRELLERRIHGLHARPPDRRPRGGRPPGSRGSPAGRPRAGDARRPAVAGRVRGRSEGVGVRRRRLDDGRLGVLRVRAQRRLGWGKGGEMPGYLTRTLATHDGRVVGVAVRTTIGPRARRRSPDPALSRGIGGGRPKVNGVWAACKRIRLTSSGRAAGPPQGP